MHIKKMFTMWFKPKQLNLSVIPIKDYCSLASTIEGSGIDQHRFFPQFLLSQ